MFFEVLGLTYHSPITIESLTCRVFRIRIRTRPGGAVALQLGHQPTHSPKRRSGNHRFSLGIGIAFTAIEFACSTARRVGRELQSQLIEMHTQLTEMQESHCNLGGGGREPDCAARDASLTTRRDQESAAGPAAFRFNGLTVTPGGFLDSTVLLRTRNENPICRRVIRRFH